MSVVVTGTALSFALGGQTSPRLGGMSNHGEKALGLAPSQLQDLARSGVDADVQFLGVRAGIRFYTSSSNGQPCFLTSNSEAPRPEFSVVLCLGPGSSRVPSAIEPIVDVSAFRKAAIDYQMVPNAPTYVTWLAGFAADGVAAVGVEGSDGAIKSTPVTNNVYAARNITSDAVTAVVALDKDKQVIYRHEIR